jgi:hypothetical protein
MDPKATAAAGAGTETVTEEQLLKSLQALEGKPTEPAAATTQTVVVEPLGKTTVQAVTDGASEQLKKALDVSAPLKEVVTLIGLHNDTTLQSLQKSLQGAAERDLTTIKVLEKLAKSLDDNTAAVKEFGKQPVTTPAARATEVLPTQVLNKSTTGGKEGEPNPAQVRKNVVAGLELLVKSCQPGTTEASKWIRTVSMFESTGKINDQDLLAARNAYENQGKK